MLVLSLVVSSKAQFYEDNFLGSDCYNYKGKFFKLRDEGYIYLDKILYGDLNNLQKGYSGVVIYPEIKNKYLTDKEYIKNRVFIIDNIVDYNGNALDRKQAGGYRTVLVLRDTIDNEVIYYKYNAYEKSFTFPFLTSKIIFDEKETCGDLFRRVDDFTDKIKISNPLGELPMMIYKDISKSRTDYYLRLSTTGSTVNVDGKGVIVIFEDGTKWTRQVKIDVDAGSEDYDYSAFITLTAADLNTFATKTIKKYRLYIYDEELPQFQGEKFKLYAACIKKAK